MQSLPQRPCFSKPPPPPPSSSSSTYTPQSQSYRTNANNGPFHPRKKQELNQQKISSQSQSQLQYQNNNQYQQQYYQQYQQYYQNQNQNQQQHQQIQQQYEYQIPGSYPSSYNPYLYSATIPSILPKQYTALQQLSHNYSSATPSTSSSLAPTSNSDMVNQTNNQFECINCERSFKNEQAFNIHLNTHVKCPDCEFEACKKMILLHQEESHPKM
jgi:hypothetical protein